MAVVLITGGTGMIGTALSKQLISRGYDVIILSRKKTFEKRNGEKATKGLRYACWDIASGFIEDEAIKSSDHIIHLAGAGIADKRWTKKRKKEIRESRIRSGALLVEKLSSIPNKIQTLISASAIGWYGTDPVIPNQKPFKEDYPPDSGFLGETCRQWEESIQEARTPGRRVITVRTGIVLSGSGGLLKEFYKPLRLGIAAILGNGKQVISWIHIDDLVNIYLRALEDKSLTGPYNAAAPHPVSNKELVRSIARHKLKFFVPVHVPPFILKTALGEMSIEVLKSTTVDCGKILSTGFSFAFPTVDSALEDIVGK